MKTKRHSRAPTSFFSSNRFKLGIALGAIVVVIALVLVLRQKFEVRAIDTSKSDSLMHVDSSGVQVVRMAVDGIAYSPSQITVEANKPVKWIVDGSRTSGCTSYLMAPEFGISRRLVKGENIIEFTPMEKGSFGFSCSMNMAKGVINVV